VAICDSTISGNNQVSIVQNLKIVASVSIGRQTSHPSTSPLSRTTELPVRR
jgi:hypothetical protein